MRLISCHIENFGKLHDFDMTFSDGLNVIRRENGWGKSTLASFIKAMLYGLDGTKKRDIDENERRRFCPWQGGIFGGRLDFEAAGRNYCVTRTFGDSPAKDTFELRDRDTNMISQDYSERLGEELFKLNSTSFYRSIFIGQSDCQTASTDDIYAKISDLADNTGDMNSFESADERLKKQINSLSPKLRTGSLFKLSEEMAALRRTVSEGMDLNGRIAECSEKIAEAESRKRSVMEKRSSLESKQKLAIRQQQLLSLRGEWERLKKTRDNIKSELDTAMAKFPSGIPDESSVRENLHFALEMRSAESLMHSYRLSSHEKLRLDELATVFENHVPSPDEIDGYLATAAELRRIREKYDRLRLTDEENDVLWQLNAAFADDSVSPSELIAKWNERSAIKNALGSKKAACASLTKSVKKSRGAAKRRAFILISAGLSLIAIGVAFFIIYSAVWFLYAAIAGVLLLSLGVFFAALIMGNFVKKIPDELIQLRDEIKCDENFIDDVECLTANYLAVHGRDFVEPDVPFVLQELLEDRRCLELLRRKQDTAEKYLLENDRPDSRAEVNNFLQKYAVQPDEGRLSDLLHELKENAAEYSLLYDKSCKFSEAKKKYSERNDIIVSFLDSYGYSAGDNAHAALEQLRDDAAEVAGLSEKYSKVVSELNAFEQSNDISVLEAADNETVPSLEAISQEIWNCGVALEQIAESVNAFRQTRDELNKQLVQWENDSCALQEKTEKLNADRLRYERLLKAREFLRTAKERMVAKYVAPVYSSFIRYHNLMAGDSADNYHIDADINVTVDELGQQREIKTLSTGFRDLVGICLRLGLADAMYPSEKPALIMDDPFTNLDDKKLSSSGKLLREVSKSYQVIYFTCSASREN